MSATAVRSEYAALLSSTLPAVIRSEAENERYIAVLEELDSKGKSDDGCRTPHGRSLDSADRRL
jgi:hypothetical protein